MLIELDFELQTLMHTTLNMGEGEYLISKTTLQKVVDLFKLIFDIDIKCINKGRISMMKFWKRVTKIFRRKQHITLVDLRLIVCSTSYFLKELF